MDIKEGEHKLEFILAAIIALFLVFTLLSYKIFNISAELISALIFIFVLVKIFGIVHRKGTIFEDYAAVFLLFLFGIVYFFTQETNSLIISMIVIILLYSVGVTFWIRKLLSSKSAFKFISSYLFFILIIIFLFAGMYQNYSYNFIEGQIPVKLKFEDTLYFSVMTFTTVGYGDISPTGINRLLASVEALLGLALNIAFIGYILASKRFDK